MLIRKFKDLLIILKIQQEKTRGEFFFSLGEIHTEFCIFLVLQCARSLSLDKFNL